MNIGIRLHDVAGATLEEKLQNAKAQGFSCVHLALSKVLPDFPMEKAPELLTPALAEELKALFAKYGLRIVVLGCYLNLATPDMEELQHTMEIYKAHLRFAPLLGAEVVGTETGNPNTAYALDENSHTEASLRLFMDRLAPLVRYAEECGAVLAIEPVCRHIVYTPQWAARVLAAFPTPHLRLILDMVNLMNMANYPSGGSDPEGCHHPHGPAHPYAAYQGLPAPGGRSGCGQPGRGSGMHGLHGCWPSPVPATCP